VTSITEAAAFRVLAAAPRDSFGLGDFHLLRRETASTMRAVAKRLASRKTARAPEINAGLDFLDEWRFLGNSWIAHDFFVAATFDCRKSI
jgi:hypothetical protein